MLNKLLNTHRQETIMSNKNPFEIRTEMLALAKDYMDQQYHMNVAFAEKALEAGKKSVEEVQCMPSYLRRTNTMWPYTPEEYDEFFG
jgi:hypothetical protein